MKSNILSKLKLTLLIGIVSFFVFSCREKGCMDPNAINYNPDAKKDAPCEYGDFDKSEMLTNICDNYIIPSYTEFNSQTNNLNTKIVNFVTTPSISNLQDLRSQWIEALLRWQDVSFIEFGPSEYILLKNQVNIYPVDTTLIFSNITSGSYNLQSAQNYDSKGFQALDFLLHQPGLSDQDHVDYFENNINARTYLTDIGNDLSSNSQYVVDQWASYQTNFKSDSESNAQGSSVSNIINGLCFYHETYMRKGKVGLPLGVFNGFSQQEMPELVECYYYGQSLPFAKRAYESMKKYINGVSYIGSNNGTGLDDYMDFVGATQNSLTLSSVISNQIDLITDNLNLLNDPLSNDILNNKPAVSECYSKMQQLVPYTKVDMTSALGVLITYQDNDGD